MSNTFQGSFEESWADIAGLGSDNSPELQGQKATRGCEEGKEMRRCLHGWQVLKEPGAPVTSHVWYSTANGLQEPHLHTRKCCKILKGNKYPHILLSLGRTSGDPEGLELIIKCSLIVQLLKRPKLKRQKLKRPKTLEENWIENQFLSAMLPFHSVEVSHKPLWIALFILNSCRQRCLQWTGDKY